MLDMDRFINYLFGSYIDQLKFGFFIYFEFEAQKIYRSYICLFDS